MSLHRDPYFVYRSLALGTLCDLGFALFADNSTLDTYVPLSKPLVTSLKTASIPFIFQAPDDLLFSIVLLLGRKSMAVRLGITWIACGGVGYSLGALWSSSNML